LEGWGDIWFGLIDSIKQRFARHGEKKKKGLAGGEVGRVEDEDPVDRFGQGVALREFAKFGSTIAFRKEKNE